MRNMLVLSLSFLTACSLSCINKRGPNETDTTASKKPLGSPSSDSSLRVDGIVLWVFDSVPGPVQDYLNRVEKQLRMIKNAPRPPQPFSESMTKEEREDWFEWQECYFLPWLKKRSQETQDPAHHLLAAPWSQEEKYAIMAGTFVLSHRLATYLHEIGLGPPLEGSCDGTLDETLHSILITAQDTGLGMLKQLDDLPSTYDKSRPKIEQRLEWIQTVLDTTVEGICEVHEPFPIR